MGLREIQAGESGKGRRAARAGLSLLSGGWALGHAMRKTAYRLRLKRPQRLDVPVLSVGNIAVGGTGKTPFVAWLARTLTEGGRHPGILARGYGPDVIGADEPGGPLNDEGAVLRHVLGDAVPQTQHAERAKAGRALRAAHPQVDVLLLDDGFQHWGLHRDLDIVLLDATNPFGFGRLLPRGRLRERPTALSRADVVVVTRVDALDDPSRKALLAEIGTHTRAALAGTRTVPRSVTQGDRTELVDSLAAERVFAVSGIGAPEAFVRTLTGLGAEVVGHRTFPDHHGGSRADWAAIHTAAEAARASRIVLTRKDAVKLRPLPPELAVLDIETEVVFGAEALLRLVQRALEP